MKLRVLLLLFASFVATPLSAQSARIQLDRFEPLPSQRTSILNVQRSTVIPDQIAEFGIFVHYMDSPLRLETGDGAIISEWVKHQLKGEIAAAIGLGDVFDIGVVLPVVFSQDGDIVPSLGRSVESPVLQDARLVPKLMLVDPKSASGIGLALSAPIYIPVGNQDQFTSVGLVRFEPKVAFDLQSDYGWIVAANLGYQGHEERVVRGSVVKQKFRVSLGTEIPVASFSLLASMYGDIPLEEGVDPNDGITPTGSQTAAVEFDAAIRWNASNSVAFQLGGGLGASGAIGVPKFRVFGGLMFGGASADSDKDGISDKLDSCPKQAEDKDGFEDADGCPEKDNDADGIEDDEDVCRDEAEDHDNFEDEDGCADLDNDKDGIMDVDDECPLVAGTVEDAGCIAADSDGDGILDKADSCPERAEDKDGFEDQDGCPEADNDGDGILDADDKCPNEAEVINGNQDDDGCPDEGKSKVRITTTKIEILEKVYFASGKATIKKVSYSLLNQVAAVLNNTQRITKIRIEGHTDSVGSDKKNLTLSQKRAESVLKYLVSRGVAGARLEAKGFGETQPISEDNAVNRRVEFKIAEVDGKPNEGAAKIEEKTEEKIVDPPKTQ